MPSFKDIAGSSAMQYSPLSMLGMGQSRSSKSSGIPKGYEMYSLPTMGGGQKELYDLFKGQLSPGLPGVFQQLLGMAGGNVDVFNKMEAPLLNKFNREILPGIANRYAGSGISGSSGMQNAMATAASDLGTNLQAQRASLMKQSMRDVLGLGEHLLGTPTQQYGLVQKQNVLNDLMNMLGQAGGQFGGAALMGLL